jgi:hypothetical protein
MQARQSPQAAPPNEVFIEEPTDNDVVSLSNESCCYDDKDALINLLDASVLASWKRSCHKSPSWQC